MKLSVNGNHFHVPSLILISLIALGMLIGTGAQSSYSQQGLFGQGKQDNNSELQHRYVMEWGWNGCGGIPYKGWEGCMSQTGAAFRCNDGARLYFIQEHCTSSVAANTKRLLQLEKSDSTTEYWQISQTEPIGDALLIQLARPVRVNGEEPASSKWVCLWTEESSVVLVYAPDREHVIDYFKIRQKEASKRKV